MLNTINPENATRGLPRDRVGNWITYFTCLCTYSINTHETWALAFKARDSQLQKIIIDSSDSLTTLSLIKDVDVKFYLDRILVKD